MKTRLTALEKLQQELNGTLHPPYVVPLLMKGKQPKYQAWIDCKKIAGGDTIDNLRFSLNQFYSV